MHIPNIETATLGGGCFWCLDAVFSKLKGVQSIVSGYAGGHHPQPNYELVCRGVSGHAEVIQIQYDDSVIHFSELLDVFFTIHDPTTLNRQGHDIGSQYRSVIFYHSDDQLHLAQQKIIQVSEDFNDPIVTQLEPMVDFFPAEPYHQNYYERNPNQGYCQMVISPKLNKTRKLWRELLLEK